MNTKKYFFIIICLLQLLPLFAEDTWQYQHTLKQGVIFPIVEQEGQYLLFRKSYYFFYQNDTLVAKGGLGGRCGWRYMKQIERGFNETKGDTLIVSVGPDTEIYTKNYDFSPRDLIIFHNDFPQEIEEKYVFRTGYIENLSAYPVYISAHFDKKQNLLSINPMVRKKLNANEWGYPPESVYLNCVVQGVYCLEPGKNQKLRFYNNMAFHQAGEYRHSLSLCLENKRGAVDGNRFMVHSNSIFIKK